ncbi:MAG: class I SAM-dependent methyltransferase [Candidatus Magasanikbacteria bacterium]|nr:class I SAM-dependent methyltransferase [Candidatus Magasanikbacteria bacterium]
MQTIILTILFLIPPAYLVYLVAVYARTKVPYVRTSRARLPLIMKEMNIGPETVIYDLGCGKGDVLFAAEKFHPKKLVGFELSPLHAWYGKIKAWLCRSKVRIHCRDFFVADISEADIIYLFLVQSAINKVWPKLKKEAKPGTKLLVLSSKIPELTGRRVVTMKNGSAVPGGIYVYTV